MSEKANEWETHKKYCSFSITDEMYVDATLIVDTIDLKKELENLQLFLFNDKLAVVE